MEDPGYLIDNIFVFWSCWLLVAGYWLLVACYLLRLLVV